MGIPPKAYDKNEEGVVIVKMSLDAGGNLVEANLVSSSGSALLDDGALGIVKVAAPFEPLPDTTVCRVCIESRLFAINLSSDFPFYPGKHLGEALQTMIENH